MRDKIRTMETSAGARSKAFEELLALKETVFRICLGYAKNYADAEDLTQDVYLKAHRSLNGLSNPESGRIRRPGRRPVLAWAGLILVLVSGVSIGVWIRSRAARTGTVLAVFEAALARSPLLRPNRADEPAGRFQQTASPGPLEQTIERALRPLFQEPLAATPGERVSPALRSISVEELDRKIGELIKGHKLELFFSEYLKNEEDV